MCSRVRDPSKHLQISLGVCPEVRSAAHRSKSYVFHTEVVIADGLV